MAAVRGHPVHSFAAREQAHRRATLLGISIVLVLSILPVVGHHISRSLASALTGVDHIGAFCVVALHVLLSPVHGAFHVALGTGLVYAIFDRWRSWHSLARALSPLETRTVFQGEKLWLAAVESGLDPERLYTVDGLPNPAFTVGLIWPRVYVASSLEENLSPVELQAVISHEAAHVFRRDPLRVTALRFLACTLFWLPALRRLADDLGDEVEIAADDYAAADQPLVLASAILKLADWRDRAALQGAVGFQRDDLLDRRILRLAGEKAAPSTHLTRRSLAGAALALLLVTASGLLAADPATEAVGVSHVRHCAHHRESALRHLFCLGFHVRFTGERCPHGLARLSGVGIPAKS